MSQYIEPRETLLIEIYIYKRINYIEVKTSSRAANSLLARELRKKKIDVYMDMLLHKLRRYTSN